MNDCTLIYIMLVTSTIIRMIHDKSLIKIRKFSEGTGTAFAILINLRSSNISKSSNNVIANDIGPYHFPIWHIIELVEPRVRVGFSLGVLRNLLSTLMARFNLLAKAFTITPKLALESTSDKVQNP